MRHRLRPSLQASSGREAPDHGGAGLDTNSRRRVAMIGGTLALMVLAMLWASAAQALAAPFQNGSFETPVSPPPFTDYAATSTAITGWTVTNGSVDQVTSTEWDAAAGNQSIDLDGTTPGTLCQTYDSGSAGNGALTFALSYNFGGATSGTVEVTVDGNPVGTFTNSSAGVSAHNMQYETETVTFPVSGASTTLCFVSESGTSSGPVIDNVVLSGSADLSLTKSAAPTGSCTAGPTPCVLHTQDVTYTLTESNAGPDTAVAPTITDTLPAGQAFVSSDDGCTAAGTPVVVTCPTLDLSDGGSTTVHIEASTTGIPSLTAPLLQTDIATVTSQTTDSNPANNAASASITVVPVADLSLTKTAAPVSPPGCSAAQAAAASATQPCVLHGQNVTYTLAETNNGPDQATAPTITDTLPTGQTFVSSDDGCTSAGTPATNVVVTCPTANLPDGSTDTIHVVASTVDIPAGVPAVISAPVVQTDNATVSSSTVDLVPANNAASATITVIPAADLALTKTSTPNPVISGQQLTYTLTATNNGPDVAVDTVITDTLPAGEVLETEAVVEIVHNKIGGGIDVVDNDAAVPAPGAGGLACTSAVSGGLTTVTCPAGNLAPGASVFATILVVPTSAGSPTNTASVASNTADPNPLNNSASNTTTVDSNCTTTTTGLTNGSIIIPTGEFLCLNDATVTGSIVVHKGAGLTETDSTTGAVDANSPEFVTVCGSTVNGSVDVTDATLIDRVGDTPFPCAGNTISGAVDATGNMGGDGGPAIVGNNVVSGSIDCKGDNPVATDDGQTNTTSGGAKLHECATF